MYKLSQNRYPVFGDNGDHLWSIKCVSTSPDLDSLPALLYNRTSTIVSGFIF